MGSIVASRPSGFAAVCSIGKATRPGERSASRHSRWRRRHGGRAITRAVEDQYQLGMRGLAAHVADLRSAVEVLAQSQQIAQTTPHHMTPAPALSQLCHD